MDVSRNPAVRGVLKLVADLVSTLAIVFGVAASLGLGLLQIGGGLKFVFGWSAETNLGYFIIIAVMTVLYIVSSSTGLQRGIKILSNVNLSVVLLLMFFVFLVGPKIFILILFVDSKG